MGILGERMRHGGFGWGGGCVMGWLSECTEGEFGRGDYMNLRASLWRRLSDQGGVITLLIGEDLRSISKGQVADGSGNFG